MVTVTVGMVNLLGTDTINRSWVPNPESGFTQSSAPDSAPSASESHQKMVSIERRTSPSLGHRKDVIDENPD
jgi:hypothetical protein